MSTLKISCALMIAAIFYEPYFFQFGLSEVAARMNVFLQGVDHYNNGNIQGAFFKFDYIWKKDDILDVVNNQRRDDNMSPTQNSTATAEPSAETSSEPSAEPSIISSSFRNAVRRWFPNTFAQQDIERANPEIIRPIQDYVPPIPSQYRGANDDVYVQSQQLYLNGRVSAILSIKPVSFKRNNVKKSIVYFKLLLTPFKPKLINYITSNNLMNI